MTNLAIKIQNNEIKSPKIDFGQTIQMVATRFDIYNSLIFEKRIEDPECIEQPLKAIHFTVIKELIRRIQKRIYHLQNHLLPFNSLMVFTNNVELADDCKCGKSTIQRAIKRLQKARIITMKVFHGTQSNYELHFDPELFKINCQAQLIAEYNQKKQERIEEAKKNLDPSKTPQNSPKRSKCTLPYTLNERYYINTEIRDEEDLQFCKSEFSNGEGNGERKRSYADSSEKGEKIHQGAKKIKNKTGFELEKETKSIELLNLAMEKLYVPNKMRVFPGAYKMALEMINKHWWQGITTKNGLAKRMWEYDYRIGFQARQLNKPGAFILYPTDYFNPNRNKGGFRGTKKFFKEWKKKLSTKNGRKEAHFRRLVLETVKLGTTDAYEQNLEKIKRIHPHAIDEFKSQVKHYQKHANNDY